MDGTAELDMPSIHPVLVFRCRVRLLVVLILIPLHVPGLSRPCPRDPFLAARSTTQNRSFIVYTPSSPRERATPLANDIPSKIPNR